MFLWGITRKPNNIIAVDVSWVSSVPDPGPRGESSHEPKSYSCEDADDADHEARQGHDSHWS